MRIVVQKYGGSSVATPEKLRAVARLVVEKKRLGFDMVVVVSAMGHATDDLLSLSKQVSKNPSRRELDMLLSTGERISMSLLAIAIQDLGERAVSLTGSQSGIITSASHTNARIMEVRPFRVIDELEAGQIVIVAGYQGVSYRRDVTTLGRGGSDTTAVALAAALDAEACEIYSDVDGVYTADPRVVPSAKKLEEIDYEEMQEMGVHGARVLNATAVEFAKERGIAIYARKTGAGLPGTIVRRNVPLPSSGVRGIAHENKVASIAGPIATSEKALEYLAAAEELGAQPRDVGLVRHEDRFHLDFTSSLFDVVSEEALEAATVAALGPGSYRSDRGTLSLVGEGVGSRVERIQRGARALGAEDVKIHGVATSTFRITFVVDDADVARGARILHSTFALDKDAVVALTVE
ncbi:MAG: aspartate kinase [Deltaproteobacteria bacterium]|nr:aspartate kinase [Deltaproteobacteria bacterium]